jgi:phosphatidylglycerophosphatase A
MRKKFPNPTGAHYEQARGTPMTPSSDASVAVAAPKPRFAYAISTVLGIGYLKPAPGTWGSLVGLIIAVLSHPFSWFLIIGRGIDISLGKDARLFAGPVGTMVLLVPSIAVWIILAYLGVHKSAEVASFTGTKDPQFVVIDEVSGVHLALILGLAPLVTPATFFNLGDAAAFALYSGMSLLNWRYLLAAFLLFRIFDIAKPFPCRWLEKLPGGWGIMADDWMAGGYAAICLRVALHFHMLDVHLS